MACDHSEVMDDLDFTENYCLLKRGSERGPVWRV